jgi:dihydropteroate synthase type 2/dihydropteroate synthase type 3
MNFPDCVGSSICGSNITTDSFSDGGLYLDRDKAIAHARHLAANGADIIELGAASSHPDASKVDASEEITRLVPVIDALAAEGIELSVDTTKPGVPTLIGSHCHKR